MINRDDVMKLATLARLKIDLEEADAFAGEIEPILEYVGQIKSLDSSNSEAKQTGITNVMREDGEPHKSGIYTGDILAEAPLKEGDYIKVKKIL